MSDYSKTTNFTAKDALASGDPNKVIKGSEHDAEYDNIATAVATKANKVSAATDGNLLEMDANGDLVDSGIANAAGVITGVTSIDGNAATATTAAAWTTTRTIGMSGDISSDSVNIDGSGNITITNTAIGVGAVDTAELAAGAVQRAKIQTGTVTLAGSVGATGSYLGITLNAYAFFPMIHTDQDQCYVTGHTTDGADPDNARFGLYNADTNSATYDVDYRYIDV